MNILIKDENELINWLIKEVWLFERFNQVYLFGSALYSITMSEDIDILVIYKEYSSKINDDLRLFSDKLEQASGKLIDLTALSIEEEKNTAFLEKITPHYLKLK